MTKQDRRKLIFLMILVAVLGATIVLGYRMNRPPTTTTAAVPSKEPKTSSNPPKANDARILLDLVEKPESDEDIGKKNLFVYRQPPAPPLPPPPPRPLSGSTPPVPGNVTQSPVVIRQPGLPPPPPPINLKYQGFAAMNSPGGQFVAFLADDSRHYNVTVGETLMGRYRIASISDKSVEVEDLEYKRLQNLPLVK